MAISSRFRCEFWHAKAPLDAEPTRYKSELCLGKLVGVLQRADAIRYFALYHYGGVYADLDLQVSFTHTPLAELFMFICASPKSRWKNTY